MASGFFSRLGGAWASTQTARFAIGSAAFYGGTAASMYGVARGSTSPSETTDRLRARVGSSFAVGAFTALRAGSPAGAALLGVQALPHLPAMARRIQSTVGNIGGST